MINNIAYSKDAIEFVTVAVQYCTFIEQTSQKSKKEFTDKTLKILPLLYLKASMLTRDNDYEYNLEQFVNEETYAYLRNSIETLLGKRDVYLEVFHNDMQYSDTPIAAFISEDLTDIYQDLKNCVSSYEIGLEETMNEALFMCQETFEQYWGQKLVNVMRALHMVKYNSDEDDDELTNENEDNHEWNNWKEQ